jgi:hypothetical protein
VFTAGVRDTLYGQAGAEQGRVAKPQMMAGHTIENEAWPNHSIPNPRRESNV